ncbi:hypothetical protein NADFUDRAFT_49250 [Nadsonia fulvescens var. elongata DSM 6958]|uniref:J domain-containing protein n=1 Tax=Nadsonia fulvescens var. elongata DSM 6958 TaxID=857566 RepID=A0A1E3PT62_9ASCO|nr:hypothetical protein NADFUDRAFT_49250 [Nadsonia fulvescens var. elongata DSM 6958]
MSTPLPDYYNILGVDSACNESDIKKAYKKLALKYHPDKNPDSSAHDIFKSVVSAYNVLSNSVDRKKYDLTRPVTPKNTSSTSFTQPFTNYQNNNTTKFTKHNRHTYSNSNNGSTTSYAYTSFTYPHSSGASTFQARFDERRRPVNPFFQDYFAAFRSDHFKPRAYKAYDNYDEGFGFAGGGLDPDGSIPPRWSRSRNYTQNSNSNGKNAKTQPNSQKPSKNNANQMPSSSTSAPSKKQNQYYQYQQEPQKQRHHPQYYNNDSASDLEGDKTATEGDFEYKDTNNNFSTRSKTEYSYASTNSHDTSFNTSGKYQFGSTKNNNKVDIDKTSEFRNFTNDTSNTSVGNNLFTEDGPPVKFAVPDPTSSRSDTASKTSKNIPKNKGVKHKAFGYYDTEEENVPVKKRNIFVPPKGSGGTEGILPDDDYNTYINSKNNGVKCTDSFPKFDFVDLTEETETAGSEPSMESETETETDNEQSSEDSSNAYNPNVEQKYKRMDARYYEPTTKMPNSNFEKHNSPIVLESDEDEEHSEKLPAKKKTRIGSIDPVEARNIPLKPSTNEETLAKGKMSLDSLIDVPPLSQTYGNFDMRNILDDIQTQEPADSPMPADIPKRAHSTPSGDQTENLRRDLAESINNTGKRPNTLFSAVNTNKRFAHRQTPTIGNSGSTSPRSDRDTVDLHNSITILSLVPPLRPAALPASFSEIELAEYGKLMEIYQTSWNDYAFKMTQYHKERAEADQKFSLELLKSTEGTGQYMKALRLDYEVKGNWAKAINGHLEVIASYLEVRKKFDSNRSNVI